MSAFSSHTVFFYAAKSTHTYTKKSKNTQQYNPPDVVGLLFLYTYCNIIAIVLDVTVYAIA
jgi:hypothetical protein